MSIVASVPRAQRFALHVAVCIRRVRAERWEPGHTVNISRSGLLVATAASFDCDERVEVIVRLSQATESVADVWLSGRITRRGPSGDVWHLATQIDQYRLHPPDRADPPGISPSGSADVRLAPLVDDDACSHAT